MSTPSTDETAPLEEPVPAELAGADEPQPIEETSHSRLKAVGMGVAAGLAVLLIGGAGIAIGIGVIDNNTAARTAEPLTASPAPEEGPTRETPSDAQAVDPVTGLAPADAASLTEAITVAVAAAGGTGATQIEVQRNGWKVEVQRSGGVEAEVLVGLDGSTTVRDDDDDDDDPLIDLAQLPGLVDISLAAAGGGAIEQISTDDDDDHLYDVDVRLENGAEVEIELDAALNIIDVDFD